MNIARALSVSEGNGVVSCVDSQSREGTVCLGNLAAWESGPEKSRQIKHEDAVGAASGGLLGLLAWIFDMSGLEARGIGGGAADLEGEGLGTPPLTPFEWPRFSALFIPKESAGLAGVGGGCSSGVLFGGPTDPCVVDRLGGSAGIAGGGKTSTVATRCVDLFPFNDILALSASLYPGKAFDFSMSWYRFSTSSFVRFGGSGGNVVGSKTGAFTLLPASIEGVLGAYVLAVPLDRVDIVEMVEDTDSLDAFLLS